VSAIFLCETSIPDFVNQTSNNYSKSDLCLQFYFLDFIFMLCVNCQKTLFYHLFLPIFHKLDVALKGLAEFDPEDDDVFILDDNEQEKN
jgi:hypothetical protein